MTREKVVEDVSSALAGGMAGATLWCFFGAPAWAAVSVGYLAYQVLRARDVALRVERQIEESRGKR